MSGSGAAPQASGRAGEATAPPLTLALTKAPREPIDMSPLTPSALGRMPPDDVRAIRLHIGNRLARVADLFDVHGMDANHLVIRGGGARLIRVGYAMESGSIAVEGDAGLYAGEAMRGGVLTIAGNAGAFAACGMQAGLLHVRGDAGAFVGGGRVGEPAMHGGTVIVDGSAGDRAGDRMRRGTILIGADAADYCGARMLAGTIVVRGRVGAGAGFAMRRGTLLLARMPSLCATFSDCGVHALEYLRVLRRYLAQAGGALTAFADVPDSVRRFVGDRACAGLGEILVAQ